MKKKIKVCILAPIHQYSDIRVSKKEAESLADAGYQVILFSRIEKSKIINNVNILKVPSLGRILRFCYLPVLLCRSLFCNASIYHCHNPDTLPIGFILKFLGKKVIYDTHEDFAFRILIKKWIPYVLRDFIAKTVSRLEALAGRVLDCVIVTQENIISRIPNAVLIRNPPIIDKEFLSKVEDFSLKIEKKPNTVIYLGYDLSENRGIRSMIQAVALVNRQMPLEFWLIGKFCDHDFKNSLKKEEGWRFVKYLNYMSPEKAFAHVRRADIGLVTIYDVADHKYTSANKLYEYQCFGIPYIASNFGKWEEELKGVSAGFFVDPKDVKEIATKILYLLKHPEQAKEKGERGRQYIVESFNWEQEKIKLLNVYNNLGGKKN